MSQFCTQMVPGSVLNNLRQGRGNVSVESWSVCANKPELDGFLVCLSTRQLLLGGIASGVVQNSYEQHLCKKGLTKQIILLPKRFPAVYLFLIDKYFLTWVFPNQT